MPSKSTRNDKMFTKALWKKWKKQTNKKTKKNLRKLQTGNKAKTG